MSAILWGILIGIGCGAIAQVLHQFFYYELAKLQLVPWRPSRRSNFLRRVRQVLAFRDRGRRLILYAPLIPLAFALGIYLSPELAIGLVLGYPVLPLLVRLTYPAWLQSYRSKIQKLAVDRLMRHGIDSEADWSEALKTLDRFAGTAPVELKAYSLRQIGRMGTPQAREVLEKYHQSTDERIQTASRAALEHLDRIVSGESLLSTRQLPVFIDEAGYWHRQYYARRGLARRDSELRQAELEEIIDDIVDSQLLLKQAYPDLFCTQCFTRAEEHTGGRWTYVMCRHCGDVVHLQTGITKVVGRIGDFREPLVENGVIYLHLWDTNKGKARFADLDRLEIVNGGDVNYNWAVSALVAQLSEHAPSPSAHIEVALQGNPPLDANSLALLREIGQVSKA
jgi:hypothetical protein